MLTHLYVRNFAVVEEAEIDFAAGLTVVTGETGAGKSLLVDALLLLSGRRADSALVRAGSERAELSAEFDLETLSPAHDWLLQQSLDDGNDCRLRRILKAEGSSRAWINDRPVSLAQLSELSPLLVEIHGQHEHQALLSRQHQLDLLDACAAAADSRKLLCDTARHWRELGVRMHKLRGADDRQGHIELLQHELVEIKRWVLSAAELQQLEAEHKRLANADRLLEGANGVLELLDADSDFTLRRALARAQAELTRLADLDPQLQPLHEMLDSAEIQIAEAANSLSHYAQDMDLDPDRYAQIDTQLAHLHDLGRRHRLPLHELADKAGNLERELLELQDADAELGKIAEQRKDCQQRYAKIAAALSKTRTEAALKLGGQVTKLMQELGMAAGSFAIKLLPQNDDEPDPLGRERCEFMVSANTGQARRPLRKVASGGELSRVGLAIKVAALGFDNAVSMVFDEVDSGIGGAVAEVVGQKLRRLGENCQVLCVTHLPQVAAQGHAHIKVSKSSASNGTRTAIEVLDSKTRHDEIARMLGGIEITRETEAHARQMIKRAQAS